MLHLARSFQCRHTDAATGGQIGIRRLRQLPSGITQGRAQPFLVSGVVEGHSQQISHREFLLNRQRQKMCHVLCLRGAHLRALQAARGLVGVNAEPPRVAQGSARTPLVMKTGATGDGGVGVQVRPPAAHGSHLRV